MKFISREYLLRQLKSFEKVILKQKYVIKENGKHLSTNDFTDENKEKLQSLENYDDTEIRKIINESTKVDTVNNVPPDSGKNITLSGEDIKTDARSERTLKEKFDEIDLNITISDDELVQIVV